VEQLTRAIADAFYLVKALFVGLGNGEGNIAAQDQEVLWGSISSLAQNVLGFLTELVDKIAAIL
jgi:hypothetical protein